MSTNGYIPKLGPAGLPAITEPWAAKDIAYVACMAPLFLMAFAEWILWILAFNYCLWCCLRKADNWSTRIMAVIIMITFTAFRAIFLPVMVFTLPMPGQITQYYPANVVTVLQWFAFWAFSGLLTIPWLFCVYQLVTQVVGRRKKITHKLDEFSAPKVVIVMPCYREKPEILLRTIDSIVDCDYPPSCMHIFLSFDGDEVGELYLSTIECLGVPVNIQKYPRSLDIIYRNSRVTVSRFPHGGKRACQRESFRLIDRVYKAYLERNDNLFVLFIDSDCILDRVCIQNFLYEMELKPGSSKNMLAMTGVITSTTEKNSLITILQDMEYIHGQLFERTVESGCGAVTCLPGALTILRFSAFRKLANEYFMDRTGQIEDVFDYSKAHLGEDRFLTHLFMIAAKHRYQIQMNPAAFCKTEAVLDFKTLLKQRRRWFLGFITNEACMLTDIRLWRKYPILLLIRFSQNTIRTTALLFFIMVISLLSTSQKFSNLPVGFIAVSLGLNWLLMLYFGVILGRYKIILYPLMFIVNPLFNWLYMVYGIFTATQRTWGGPRADASKADDQTTPAEAIAHAEEQGDDLNVDAGTFRQEAQRRKSIKGLKAQRMSLLPPANLEGRFTSAIPLAGGWFVNDSSDNLPATVYDREFSEVNLAADDAPTRPRKLRRKSAESTDTSATAKGPYAAPRRVESFVSANGLRQYHLNQAEQAPAGGAVFANSDPYQFRGQAEQQSQFKFGYLDSGSSSMASSVASTPGGSPNLRPQQPGQYDVRNFRSEVPPALELGSAIPLRGYAQRAIARGTTQGPGTLGGQGQPRQVSIPLTDMRHSAIGRPTYTHALTTDVRNNNRDSHGNHTFLHDADELLAPGDVRDPWESRDPYLPSQRLISLPITPAEGTNLTTGTHFTATKPFDRHLTSLEANPLQIDIGYPMAPLTSHPGVEHFLTPEVVPPGVEYSGSEVEEREGRKRRRKLNKGKWKGDGGGS